MRRVKRSRRPARSRGRSRRTQRPWWDIGGWHTRWYSQLWPWRRRLTLASAGLTAVGTLVGMMIWADRADVPARASSAIRAGVADMSRQVGFSIREVFVSGRKEAARQQLLDALDVRLGDPILFFDPEESRQRLLQLGWIGEARIERRLPDTIMIFLTERTPLAIWQNDKRFVLVDKDGAVIGPDGLDRYRHLKIIVGDDAPKHAARLLAMLGDEPDLMKRVTHAIWVSGRRWNIRIDDAIDVRLPANDPDAAWRNFAVMERKHGLLRREISAVDLRVPGRMTVRTNQKPAKAAQRDERT